MRGIDVSSHNGKIDWKAVKSSGIDFAIIRAGYGNSTEDKCFAENVKGAYEVGIKVGVYWFSYALTVADAIKEADYCLSIITKYNFENMVTLPIFYDFEYDTERYASERGVTYTNELRTDIIKSFCGELLANGIRGGVYLNPDYIKYKVDYEKLKAYPLWEASWVNNTITDFSVPKKGMPFLERNPFLWQFGKGHVLGIEGDVDLNYGYFVADTDNTPQDWSKEAVEWAVKNGILKGDENGDYKLRDNITTERFITMLHRAIKTIKLNIGE